MDVTGLPKELLSQLSNCSGVNCECCAYGECECGCEADWRSRDEVVMEWMREYSDTRHEILDAYLPKEQGEYKMKTNYDHIIEGGIEALADVVANHTCQDCSFCADCKTEGDNLANCVHGVMEWLNQPYIEPDSWLKWEEDMLKLITDYWGCTGSFCKNCPSMIDGKRPRERYGVDTCGYAMRKELVIRAKKLRSAE